MRWEYKRSSLLITEVAEAGFEDQLNALGGDGWELVSALHHDRNGYTRDVYLVFRRPLTRASAAVGR